MDLWPHQRFQHVGSIKSALNSSYSCNVVNFPAQSINEQHDDYYQLTITITGRSILRCSYGGLHWTVNQLPTDGISRKTSDQICSKKNTLATR